MDKQECWYLRKQKQQVLSNLVNHRIDVENTAEENFRKHTKAIECISNLDDEEIKCIHAPDYTEVIRDAEIQELMENNAPESQIIEVEEMDDQDVINNYAGKHIDAVRNTMINEHEEAIARNDELITKLDDEIEEVKGMPLKEFKDKFNII